MWMPLTRVYCRRQWVSIDAPQIYCHPSRRDAWSFSERLKQATNGHAPSSPTPRPEFIAGHEGCRKTAHQIHCNRLIPAMAIDRWLCKSSDNGNVYRWPVISTYCDCSSFVIHAKSIYILLQRIPIYINGLSPVCTVEANDSCVHYPERETLYYESQ